MEWLQLTATVLSALAAVLAWAAKLWWSKEFAAAKDETIRAKEAEIKAKEAQIQTLEREIETFREFTPMKIREYFLSVTAQLNEYNESLKLQVDKFNEEIATKDVRIGELSEAGAHFQNDVNRLIAEKAELEGKVVFLEDQETKLKPVQDQFISVSGTFITFADQYPGWLESIQKPLAEIAQAFGQDFYKSNAELFQQLGESLAQVAGIKKELPALDGHITVIDSDEGQGKKSVDESKS